jgi:hypothetical protein
VDWYHGVLQPDEFSRVRFIDYSYWIELSGGSRRPRSPRRSHGLIRLSQRHDSNESTLDREHKRSSEPPPAHDKNS